MEKAIRLDKYLADMGKGTRTELKEMIRKGRIKVNGEVVKKPETKIRKGEDTILLDNAPVEYVELEYYLLNKIEQYDVCCHMDKLQYDNDLILKLKLIVYILHYHHTKLFEQNCFIRVFCANLILLLF